MSGGVGRGGERAAGLRGCGDGDRARYSAGFGERLRSPLAALLDFGGIAAAAATGELDAVVASIEAEQPSDGTPSPSQARAVNVESTPACTVDIHYCTFVWI